MVALSVAISLNHSLPLRKESELHGASHLEIKESGRASTGQEVHVSK